MKILQRTVGLVVGTFKTGEKVYRFCVKAAKTIAKVRTGISIQEELQLHLERKEVNQLFAKVMGEKDQARKEIMVRELGQIVYNSVDPVVSVCAAEVLMNLGAALVDIRPAARFLVASLTKESVPQLAKIYANSALAKQSAYADPSNNWAN